MGKVWNKEKLITDYVNTMLSDIDHDLAISALTGYVIQEKKTYTIEQLLTEIREYYPQILEEE